MSTEPEQAAARILAELEQTAARIIAELEQAAARVSAAPPNELPRTPLAYLSLKQLARYSGLGVRTLRERLRDPHNPLPHQKIGDRVLVRVSAFDAWMDGFRVAGPQLPAHLQPVMARARELTARLKAPKAP